MYYESHGYFNHVCPLLFPFIIFFNPRIGGRFTVFEEASVGLESVRLFCCFGFWRWTGAWSKLTGCLEAYIKGLSFSASYFVSFVSQRRRGDSFESSLQPVSSSCFSIILYKLFVAVSVCSVTICFAREVPCFLWTSLFLFGLYFFFLFSLGFPFFFFNFLFYVLLGVCGVFSFFLSFFFFVSVLGLTGHPSKVKSIFDKFSIVLGRESRFFDSFSTLGNH